MSEFVATYPVARKRHRCQICRWSILPGETYQRIAVFEGTAWTCVTCLHCERVAWAYCVVTGEDECFGEDIVEWLSDEHSNLAATMRAGWRWPDGERVPFPFGSACDTCGATVPFRHLWCGPCDEARIARLNGQFADLVSAVTNRHNNDRSTT